MTIRQNDESSLLMKTKHLSTPATKNYQITGRHKKATECFQTVALMMLKNLMMRGGYLEKPVYPIYRDEAFWHLLVCGAEAYRYQAWPPLLLYRV